MLQDLSFDTLQLFCEKNSDGSKNLRLKGRELWQRFGARLEDADMLQLVKFLNNNLGVKKLDLCCNNIGDDGMEILAEEYFMRPENTLEHLNLANNNITGNGMKYLCFSTETMELKTLRINGNKLGYDGGRFVAQFAKYCPTLELLDVGDTDQTLATVNFFMNVLPSYVDYPSGLRVLDLSRIVPMSHMYQYDPAHLAESLGRMLKVNSSLVELHIQRNEFDGHDIELLLYGLEQNKTMLLLDLGYNRFGDHGIELIAKWLKKRPNLLGLNVAGCGIRNVGARALSFGMPFSKVRLLDISDNKIEDVGMIDILNSIKKPYMMRLLYFWGNKLSEKTLLVVHRMLESGVLVQDQIDIKLYMVDEVFYAAYYPTNHYKHRYFGVMNHGCAVELRIKRNIVDHEYAQPRELVKFEHYVRFPEVDRTLPPKIPPC